MWRVSIEIPFRRNLFEQQICCLTEEAILGPILQGLRPVQTDCIKLSWIESFLTQFSLCTLCKATYSTAFKAVRMNMA